ncbi:MAG: AEC family transporter [Verrucomicrobia bacterium]|nr:MAG: AEC family transporter [Verrucomicrobiota bacterium]
MGNGPRHGMIDFWVVLSAVMPVYSLMGVGVWLRRAEWLTHEADDSLVRVVVNVLTPCLIVDNVLGNPALRQASNLVLPPLFGFGGILLGIGAAWVLRRHSGAEGEKAQRTFALAAGFQNYGYAALPLVIMLFPPATTGVLFLHNVGVDVALWTVGLVTLGHAGIRDWRRLVNAPLVAVLVAVPLNLADARLPGFLQTSNHALAQCCFPLALVLSGAMLAESLPELHGGGGWRVMAMSCVARCGLAPLLLLAAARWLPASLPLRQVLVIEASMPAAIIPIILARRYGGHPLTAVRVVAATSALGFATIPAWIRFGFWFVGLPTGK